MSQETQPALSELVDAQAVLDQIKNDLDLLSDCLVEDGQTLIKMRSVHSTAKGLHEFVRTLPTARRAA